MTIQPYEDMMVARIHELRSRMGWTEGAFGRVWWINSARSNVGRYPVLADSAEQVVEVYQKGFETDEIPTVESGDWDAVSRLASCGYQTVDPYEWEPNPDYRGCIRVRRCKQLGEVAEELRAYLGREHEESVESPLGPFVASRFSLWPAVGTYNRLAVFSVPGGSEGDYVHVEALGIETVAADEFESADVWDFAANRLLRRRRGSESELLLLSKTFGGRDESWRLARRVADLLGV